MSAAVNLSLSCAASTARNHRHANLGFPIVVLLSLMPLRFQSINIATPFETHSALMSMFVIATLVYAISWAIEAKHQTDNNPYHHAIITKISILSASLATVLLVLVIVPTIGWFVLFFWTLFLMKLVYDACQKLLQLSRAISSASDVFNELLGLGARHNDAEILLPV